MMKNNSALQPLLVALLATTDLAISAVRAGGAAIYLAVASKYPLGGYFDRIQIIKDWTDTNGSNHEKVFDIAWSVAQGVLPALGNTVDPATTSYRNDIGAAQLAILWSDCGN